MLTGTKFKMKPPMSTRPVTGHPLTKGIVGCWLANEGAGSRIFDLSEYGNHATLHGSAGWRLSQLGVAMDSQGSNNNSSTAFDGTQYDELSISAWVIPDVTTSTRYIVDNSPGATGYGLRLVGTELEFFCFNSGSPGIVGKADFFTVGKLAHIVAIHNSKNIIYGDGIYLNETNSALGIDDSLSQMHIGGDYISAFGWDGAIVLVQIWNRSLSAGEVTWLYREPFAMFAQSNRTQWFYAPTSGTVSLGGSASGESASAGSIGLSRKLTGATSSSSAATGILRIGEEALPFSSSMIWLKDSLFVGMTANAIKLGTALSLGWFWTRVGGCTALYRGDRLDNIDFGNVLSVGNLDVGHISPPTYVQHGVEATYVYAVRRFNRCGDRENTLGAIAKISFDANGDLAEPCPNIVFNSKVEVVEGNRVRLKWFYSALKQKSCPLRFNIYGDSGSGQIDYDDPVASIDYQGMKHYSYTAGPFDAGRYLFVINAEDEYGVESSTSSISRIQIKDASPDAIEILSVKAV